MVFLRSDTASPCTPDTMSLMSLSMDRSVSRRRRRTARYIPDTPSDRGPAHSWCCGLRTARLVYLRSANLDQLAPEPPLGCPCPRTPRHPPGNPVPDL